MKIWCLLSVDNNYDQPSDNLVAWWPKRPAIQNVIPCIEPDERFTERAKPIAEDIMKGKEIRYAETDYRLRQISHGLLRTQEEAK